MSARKAKAAPKLDDLVGAKLLTLTGFGEMDGAWKIAETPKSHDGVLKVSLIQS
jgi:hypothetical protein